MIGISPWTIPTRSIYVTMFSNIVTKYKYTEMTIENVFYIIGVYFLIWGFTLGMPFNYCYHDNRIIVAYDVQLTFNLN